MVHSFYLIKNYSVRRPDAEYVWRPIKCIISAVPSGEVMWHILVALHTAFGIHTK
ncbi:hypothetical protein KFK09_017980 [Dendrobium nobile]|uniref:Uncharacterized protein n=1 Tax=Dendrobium nobile TaxID=94219 RepID=A0A8T3AVM4_DENNO|nr:hypothetical protein KFK09_017980 [Dendrobium nobile]